MQGFLIARYKTCCSTNIIHKKSSQTAPEDAPGSLSTKAGTFLPKPESGPRNTATNASRVSEEASSNIFAVA